MAGSLDTSGAPEIKACTVSRDIQDFDLLIEDMDSLLGEGWGDLSFEEAQLFLKQDDSASLNFLAIAMDLTDEGRVDIINDIIRSAKNRGLGVLLIAENIAPSTLHNLLQSGADEFLPYPLPEGALKTALERIEQAKTAQPVATHENEKPATVSGPSREGAVIAVQGLAGGSGATTFATNLAFELATLQTDTTPRVCLLDFDFQSGSVATYLDITRLEAVGELLGDIESLDEDVFTSALQTVEDKLCVLSSPADIVPLDIVDSEGIQRLVDVARHKFDYVFIDMPTTLVHWTEAVLNQAHIYFATIEMDMRSAQNALRLKRALQAEGLPFNKLRFVMNRAPKFTDLNGKARVKRLGESLGVEININLPDGGKAVRDSADHGLPLASTAAKNPLCKEISKIAKELDSLAQSNAEAA